MRRATTPPRKAAKARAAAVLAALAVLLAVLAAPAAAAARRALHQTDADSSADEPVAADGVSLADSAAAAAATTTAALPSGQGPLYSTTATITGAMEQWARASSSPAGRLSLLKLKDPLALPPGSADGSPSYGAALTALRLTDPSVPSGSGKRRAVLTCSTHARELITGETCFALLRLFAGADDGVVKAASAAAAAAAAAASAADPAEPDPSAALWRWREMRDAMFGAGLLTRAESASAQAAAEAFRARVAPRVMRELDLVVLPVVNAEGRDTIERSGNYTLRKAIDARAPNRRPQVDPNRSYPWQWRQSSKGTEGSDTYTGTKAAWPWEVRAVAALLANSGGNAAGEGAKAQLDAAIDVHSGIHALLYPYGYTCDTSTLPQDRLDYWQRASDAAAGAWGKIITGPTASALYVAAGTTSEYAYSLGARLATTPEIYSGGGEGRNVGCPRLAAWAAACAGSDDTVGQCACADGATSSAVCKSLVAPKEEEEDSSAGGGAPSASSSSSASSVGAGFGGGELTPLEVLREARLLRAAGEGELAAAAERDAARRLGLPEDDAAGARAAARAFLSAGGGEDEDEARYYTGEVDPEEAQSAHYQPGKWPAGVTPGVDLADAIQMGEPVRAAGEAWYARDPYLRHWPRASRNEKYTFSFFNPTTAADYRKTVSEYAAGILAMLLAT